MPEGTSIPGSPQCDSKSESFVKEGSPYGQAGRFYLGLKSSLSGICANELQDGIPVSFVSHCTVQEDTGVERLKRTSHTNLLGLKEVFVGAGSAFFLYEQWGIALNELQGLSRVFQLGEVEVATVCEGILQGLKYIHNDLGICHGDLTCSTVLINDEGNVKITGIGESMIRKPVPQGKSQDIKATCNIARTLLGLNNVAGVRGVMGHLAQDFTSASSDATVEELLQHQFLQTCTAPQCLRPINILCTIAGERKDDPRK